MTAVCERFLGVRKMPWTGDWDETHLEELVEDFLNAGNFSRKDSTRNVLIKLSQEDTLLSSVTAMTKKRYPFCSKHPLLLPIGFLLYGCHYLWYRLTGKRKWGKLNKLNESRKRKELYDTFELFKTG